MLQSQVHFRRLARLHNHIVLPRRGRVASRSSNVVIPSENVVHRVSAVCIRARRQRMRAVGTLNHDIRICDGPIIGSHHNACNLACVRTRSGNCDSEERNCQNTNDFSPHHAPPLAAIITTQAQGKRSMAAQDACQATVRMDELTTREPVATLALRVYVRSSPGYFPQPADDGICAAVSGARLYFCSSVFSAGRSCAFKLRHASKSLSR